LRVLEQELCLLRVTATLPPSQEDEEAQRKADLELRQALGEKLRRIAAGIRERDGSRQAQAGQQGTTPQAGWPEHDATHAKGHTS